MAINITRVPFRLPAGLPEGQARLLAQQIEAIELAKREREQLEAERERLKAMPPEYVLTLVHGTQLPLTGSATWVDPNSALSRALTAKLGWRVAIEPFKWGGANSAKERAESAASLRDHLGSMRKKYENARQVVIAHSHGGNVAVSAINSSEEANQVLGVVTLGTPFLSASRRHIELPLDLGAGIFAALASGFSVVVMGAVYGHGWTWWKWGGLAAAGVALALLIGTWLTRKMHAFAERTFAGMPRTALAKDQLLIIRTTGDEAAAALAGARVAGAFIDVAWRGFSAPIIEGVGRLLEKWDYLGLKAFDRDFVRAFEKRDDPPAYPQWQDTLARGEEPTSVTGMIAKYLLPVSGPLIAAWFQEPQDSAGRWALAAIALLYAVPALLALLITVVSVPFVAVVAIGLMPSGWTLPFAGPFLDVTAEPAPPGTWNVTHFEPDAGRGLSHSKSYEDWRVFDAIADWIQERVKAGRVVPG